MNTVTYAGLLCDSVEFFTRKGRMKFIQSGQVRSLSELPFPIIETIKKTIQENEDLKTELEFHHPDSEWDQIEMFCSCRFGGLDFYPDLKDGKLSDGDYWDCPVRGNCRSEGIICKSPVFKGKSLSKDEVKLIQLLSTNETNESIADTMGTPLGSFHLAKKKLYEKLGNIQTKQELTLIAVRLNLISV